MEQKGLRVNMGKTKIMESGINLDVLKKSGKYPCGVCLTGVGSTNAGIFLPFRTWGRGPFTLGKNSSQIYEIGKI